MAILIFSENIATSDDNIEQAVKTAELLENFINSDSYSPKIKEPIIIVLNTNAEKDAAHSFLNSSSIQVQTFLELEKNLPSDITCGLEVGYYPSCQIRFWEETLYKVFQEKNISVISLPDYNEESQGFDMSLKKIKPISKISFSLKISSGFKNGGVIRNDSLLAATANPSLLLQRTEKTFQELDPKLKKYLGFDWVSYHHNRHFSYLYGFEDTRRFYVPGNNPEAKTYTSYTTPQFFFQEHIALSGNSDQSQDILCLGSSIEEKRKALQACKKILLENKYTTISFINLDKEIDNEEVLHHIASSSPKEYRVFYASKLSLPKDLPLLTEHIAGVFGDLKPVEAMAAGKLVTYHCELWKADLAEGYLNQVQEKTQDKKTIALAEYLIKKNLGKDHIIYDEKHVLTLLKDKTVTEALKKINSKLIAENQYNETLIQVVVSEILKKEKEKQREEAALSNTQIILLKTLSKRLLEAVEKNKRTSLAWQKRHQAASNIFNRVRQKDIILKQLDAIFILQEVETIQKNKPQWNEHCLLTKIFDLLSLGIIPLIRYCFFPDLTMPLAHKVNNIFPFNPKPS